MAPEVAGLLPAACLNMRPLESCPPSTRSSRAPHRGAVPWGVIHALHKCRAEAEAEVTPIPRTQVLLPWIACRAKPSLDCISPALGTKHLDSLEQNEPGLGQLLVITVDVWAMLQPTATKATYWASKLGILPSQGNLHHCCRKHLWSTLPVPALARSQSRGNQWRRDQKDPAITIPGQDWWDSVCYWICIGWVGEVKAVGVLWGLYHS